MEGMTNIEAFPSCIQHAAFVVVPVIQGLVSMGSTTALETWPHNRNARGTRGKSVDELKKHATCNCNTGSTSKVFEKDEGNVISIDDARVEKRLRPTTGPERAVE